MLALLFLHLNGIDSFLSSNIPVVGVHLSLWVGSKHETHFSIRGYIRGRFPLTVFRKFRAP